MAAVFAAVMILSIAAYAAAPAIQRWMVDINRFDVHNIVDTERGISFSMGLTEYGTGTPAPYHVTLEEASKTAAAAIYDRFNFCIDGMQGYIHFIDNSANGFVFWSAFILSYEHTSHSHATDLFHFTICAITGEVFSLIMNTPETPFLG